MISSFHLKYLSVFWFFFLGGLAAAECVPAKVFIRSDLSSGMFLRVNPKGTKVISTNLEPSSKSNRTQLLTISEQNDSKEYSILKFETPFNDEAYPVDTLTDEWSLVASPNHDGKMRYYELDEVIKQGKRAQPIFEDYNNDYYHSTAELGGSSENRKTLRTLLWKNQSFTDYEYTKAGAEHPAGMKVLRTGRICQNIVMKNLSSKEQTEERNSRNSMDRLSAELTLTVFKLKAQGKTEEDVEKIVKSNKIVEQMKSLKINDKVSSFDQPILNKTGNMVAAVVDNNLKVFKINEDGSCLEVHDLGTYSSKARFSYPQADGAELVAYKKKVFDGMRLVDRIVLLNLKTLTESLVPLELSVSSFVEFIKDGRIFFFSQSPQAGYWVIDLNQISPTGQIQTNPASCVKRLASSNSLFEKKGSPNVR